MIREIKLYYWVLALMLGFVLLVTWIMLKPATSPDETNIAGSGRSRPQLQPPLQLPSHSPIQSTQPLPLILPNEPTPTPDPIPPPRFGLFMFEYPWPCDPANPPDGESSLCPPDILEPYGNSPLGLKDFGEMVKSTSKWPNAANAIDTFGIGDDVLLNYLNKRDPETLDGLEAILRRGYLDVTIVFAQEGNGTGTAPCGQVWRFDPNHQDYSWSHAMFYSAKESLEKLKSFLIERNLSDSRVSVFIDTYDVVAFCKFDISSIPPSVYARELAKQVKMVRSILPNAFIHIHEAAPFIERSDPSKERIKNHIIEFINQARILGTRIDGLSFDAILGDPRPIDDICRIRAVDEGLSITNDIAALEEILELTKSVGLWAGVFIHPAINYFDFSDSCSYPASDQDAYESLVAGAQMIKEMSLRPDFYLISSWVKFPKNGLPESSPYTATRAFLDVFSILAE